MNKRKKLLRALVLIAGDSVQEDDYELFGWNPFNFSYYGKPEDSEVRKCAAAHLYDLILPLIEPPQEETDDN